MASLLAALALLAGASCSALPGQRLAPRDPSVGQVVSTSSGRIAGHAAPHAPSVSEYLGIPFAKPPVGDLRWLAPQAFNSSGDAFNASSFGITCASNGILGGSGIRDPAFRFSDTIDFGPQGVQVLDNEAQTGYPSGEDCLTLNVWSALGRGEERKAVMVWFYGGGFNFGSTQDPWYNGQWLAENQDVVVVTVNYRTNIFGFPGAPGLPRQNLGFLDQRLAIEWVRDNVAGFGGDPERITMFGQSAGATSTDYYSFAWYDKDPIINGMIMQSGSVFREKPFSPDKAANLWYEYTQKLGCGGQSDDQAKVLACMRSKSTSDILTAIGGMPGLELASKAMQFFPVIDNMTAFSDYDARALAGQFIKKPLLIGGTNDEAGVAQPIVQGYLGIPIPQPVIDLINFAVFNCPTAARANYQVQNGVPTWRYRWFGLAPNTVIAYEPDTGAYHESDIPFVFGSTEVYGGANTDIETKVVEYIQGAWAAFAKDPESGLTEYGWPKYDEQNNILQLARDNKTEPDPAASAVYDTGCAVINFKTTKAELLAQIQALAESLGFPGNDVLQVR